MGARKRSRRSAVTRHGKITVTEKAFPRYRKKFDKMGRRKWKLFGECIKAEGKIWIHDKLTPRSRLNTLIHEVLHVVEPEWSETRVERRASTITRVLWEQGYRRKFDKKPKKG